MKQFFAWCCLLMMPSGLLAQQSIDLYFGPSLYSRVHLFSQDLNLSDGSRMTHLSSTPQVLGQFGGVIGVQLPIVSGISFRMGASYQPLIDLRLYHFVLEDNFFGEITKGQNISWHIVNVESALRYTLKNFGIEAGLFFANNFRTDAGQINWRELSDAQNQFYNDQINNLKRSFLFYHFGLSYRIGHFDLLFQYQWARNVFNPAVFEGQSYYTATRIRQISYGLNYHLPVYKFK
jgi:hypothetical protein